MSSENSVGLIRAFAKANTENDIEKALSLCTEDIIWKTPYGTFKGKEEVRRYMTWNSQNISNLNFDDTNEVGILIQGDKASYARKFSCTTRGVHVNTLMICTYIFSDNKIKELKTVFDRLALAEQASTSWLPKKFVNSIVKNMRKGLE